MNGILPVETVTVESVDGCDVTRAYTGEITSLQASELGFERSGEPLSCWFLKALRYRLERRWPGWSA